MLFELIYRILFCAAIFGRKKWCFSLLSGLICLLCDSGRLGNDCWLLQVKVMNTEGLGGKLHHNLPSTLESRREIVLCQHVLCTHCLRAKGELDSPRDRRWALAHFRNQLFKQMREHPGGSTGSAAGVGAAGDHHLAVSRLRQCWREPLGNRQVDHTAGVWHHLLHDLALMRHLLEFCTLFKDLLCGKSLHLQ